MTNDAIFSKYQSKNYLLTSLFWSRITDINEQEDGKSVDRGFLLKKTYNVFRKSVKNYIVCNIHVLLLVLLNSDIHCTISETFFQQIKKSICRRGSNVHMLSYCALSCWLDVGSSLRIQLREILSVHITIEGPSQLILLEFDIKFKFQRSQTERLQKLPFMQYLPFTLIEREDT